MMATLQVPGVRPASLYPMDTGSTTELVASDTDDSNKEVDKNDDDVFVSREKTSKTGRADGIGVYLDNIAFKIDSDEDDREKEMQAEVEENDDGLETPPLKNTHERRDSEDSIDNNDDGRSEENSRKVSLDVSSESSSPRRRKSVQILDIPKIEQLPKPESKLKKYRLHVSVAVIFTVIIVGLSLVWHFHKAERLAIKMGQKISFEPTSRILTFSNIPSTAKFLGQLGAGIPRGWLPLDCTTSPEDGHSICLNWKRIAQLDISYFPLGNLSCYGIYWTLYGRTEFLKDCYRSSATWFGPSNVGKFQWPINNTMYLYFPKLSDNRKHESIGFLYEHFWVSSDGMVIILNSSFPFHVSWARTEDMELCVSSNRTLWEDMHHPPSLNYSICYGGNIRESYETTKRAFLRNGIKKWPNREVFDSPHWSFKPRTESNWSQVDVMEAARRVGENALGCGTFEIDGKWESEFGDLDFDRSKFWNITQVLDRVAGAKCDLALPVGPYSHHDSASFAEGLDRGYFMMDAGGKAPGLTLWKYGISAVLDVSNKNAVRWFTSKLKHLAKAYNIRGFRFTCRDNATLPFQPHASVSLKAGDVTQRFTQIITGVGDHVIVNEVSQAQNLTVFVSVKSRVKRQGSKLCLHGMIEKTFTLGLVGYPFIISEGFSNESELDAQPSSELFSRWLQTSIFFPAVSFTSDPWLTNASVTADMSSLLKIRKEYVLPVIEKMKQDVTRGLPIIRPLWWASPDDQTAIVVTDEFLVGNSILVAPVLCESVQKRHIYIPEGIWEDAKKRKVVNGPKWLKDYSVTQTDVPYFVRRAEHGDEV